mmetsp:Transcript_39181/g.59782  ORF Transcript_39181/g.59782 Transcript_39181/m.59782 type:complete len:87 (+) Transcript_39181:1039-1299(+)
MSHHFTKEELSEMFSRIKFSQVPEYSKITVGEGIWITLKGGVCYARSTSERSSHSRLEDLYKWKQEVLAPHIEKQREAHVEEEKNA